MNNFSIFVDTSFEEAIDQVTEALKQEGMGVLNEIDVQATLKKKIDVNFRRYKILGACHALIAYEMLQTDDKAGLFYPCNVVVQEHEDGRIEVSAVDPLMMFLTIHSPKAKEIALNASEKMQRVIESLKSLQLISHS
ncbi:DUF302 domain-containing protein [Cyanobacterium sp. Dongsha4]|uniref:DUF302 domain-containing protein n=1 Tax=Cyanobacterium sp. DS4 TaxID=2878255 RepID=UPI002E822321|nr:DUF302 domain-containing protein [Cyanobacterium sp. Dongsha4]WVL00803.1 DUF302 domain-containing protein [Cyanobacterium sp. Dongsha4]